MEKIIVLAISSKRDTRIYFSNLKQTNIIKLCNSEVKPRRAYTKKSYNPLVLKNVVFSANVTFLCIFIMIDKKSLYDTSFVNTLPYNV